MKRAKTFLLALLTATVLVVPSLSGTMSTSAYYVAAEEEEESDGITLAEALAGAAIASGVIEKLFCPKTPQNRCKGGKCKTGACISFRSACGDIGSTC